MIRSSLGLAVLAAMTFGAEASVLHDQSVTNNVIMGSGIANGGFTVDRANNIEVGLRARERYSLASDAPTGVTGSNGDGTFDQNPGSPAANPTRARWNFDWSINSDQNGLGGAKLNSLTYRLGMDFDAGAGTNFQSFDPLNLIYGDHSFGNNGTAQSAGVEAPFADSITYASLLANNNLAQNSWNFDFFDGGAYPFNPAANGTYTIFLEAYLGGALQARSEIDVIVGTGAAVPEPASLALIGLALAGFALSGRRRT